MKVSMHRKNMATAGASIQQKLSGCEKPLLSDSDWTHERTVYGGMGRDMEKGKAEFGAETQEAARVHERDIAERIHGRDRQKDTNTVYIKMIWERRWL